MKFRLLMVLFLSISTKTPNNCKSSDCEICDAGGYLCTKCKDGAWPKDQTNCILCGEGCKICGGPRTCNICNEEYEINRFFECEPQERIYYAIIILTVFILACCTLAIIIRLFEAFRARQRVITDTELSFSERPKAIYLASVQPPEASKNSNLKVGSGKKSNQLDTDTEVN